MYMIAVFRSTTETYSFCSLLKSYNINAFVENTPRQAEVSCGLCVHFPTEKTNVAFDLLKRRIYSSFVNMFSVQNLGNGFLRVNKIVV